MLTIGTTLFDSNFSGAAFGPGGVGFWCRRTRGGVAGPRPLEHDTNQHERDKTQMIEKKSGNHGKPPHTSAEMRSLYLFSDCGISSRLEAHDPALKGLVNLFAILPNPSIRGFFSPYCGEINLTFSDRRNVIQWLKRAYLATLHTLNLLILKAFYISGCAPPTTAYSPVYTGRYLARCLLYRTSNMMTSPLEEQHSPLPSCRGGPWH